MQLSPALVGVVAGLVLVAGGVTASVQRDRAADLDRLVAALPAGAEPRRPRLPLPTPTTPVPGPVSAPPAVAPAPVPGPVAVPTAPPAVPQLRPPPPRPPEPEQPRTRQFQGLHGPLPTGCTGPGYACAYPDATGPVSGGVSSLDVQAQSSTSVSVTWTPGTGRGWPSPVGFVLFVYADGAVVHESRHETAITSAVAEGLPSGGSVAVYLHELNSEGLSPAHYSEAFLPPAPAPVGSSGSADRSPAP